MEQIRSFISVDLPREVRQSLAGLQDKLRSGSGAVVKWVEPSNIHLTLKFLGNISPGMTGRITVAIGKASRGIQPFRIQVKGIGAFPNLERVNIVWVGLTGNIDGLKLLQRRIDTQLLPLGFKSENRPFSPHLTIARLRDRSTPDERRKLGQLISDVGFDIPYSLDVKTVHLMKSQLTREGPIYSRIGSVDLR